VHGFCGLGWESVSVTLFSLSLALQWVQQYIDGKLTPTIKSEAIPEKNDGPVKVIVAKTLQSLVFESDSDVFIEFYAPCRLCYLVL